MSDINATSAETAYLTKPNIVFPGTREEAEAATAKALEQLGVPDLVDGEPMSYDKDAPYPAGTEVLVDGELVEPPAEDDAEDEKPKRKSSK